jgi:hypothetical protein
MDELRAVAPQLEQSLRKISSQLEQGSFIDRSKSLSNSSPHAMILEQEAARLSRLNKEWLAKVDEVRKLDGFHDFLRPTRLPTLQVAANSSPIVVLNAGKTGCAALILTSSGPVQVVPLPAITFVKAEML